MLRARSLPVSASSSTARRTSIRRIAALLAACVLTGLAACGDDGGSDGSASATTTAPPVAAEDAGPVVVEHLYGETEINEVPERIVTVGYHGADPFVALGVVPVGMERDDNGADEDGLQPWLRQALVDLGADFPDVDVRNEAWEIDYEHIASLEPDLIVATRGWISEDEYGLLAAIAPTVGPLVAQGNPGPWDDEMRLVARILGREEAAEAVIADVEAQIAVARAAHPRLDGTTVAWGYDALDGQMEFLRNTFGGLNTLRLFGITDDPSVTAVGLAGAEPWITSVSLERLAEVETDFALVLAYGPELSALDHPVFTGWTPIAEGRYIYYADYLIDSAISNPTALNLTWLIDDSGFLELVERALDGEGITILDDGSVRSRNDPTGG